MCVCVTGDNVCMHAWLASLVPRPSTPPALINRFQYWPEAIESGRPGNEAIAMHGHETLFLQMTHHHALYSPYGKAYKIDT